MDDKLEEFELKPFNNTRALKFALIAGVIFLCIGFYNVGFKIGAEEVIEYTDAYKSRYCSCLNENIKKNNNNYPKTKLNFSTTAFEKSD